MARVVKVVSNEDRTEVQSMTLKVNGAQDQAQAVKFAFREGLHYEVQERFFGTYVKVSLNKTRPLLPQLFAFKALAQHSA